MSRFTWEPPTKLELGEGRARPRTAPDLLRELGVEGAPPSQQRQAVNGWLLEHSADDLMRVSLRRKGLPAASVDVALPSRRHVRVMTGSATFVSGDAWTDNALLVFPRPRTEVVHYGFLPTRSSAYVVGTISDHAPDELQPERKRDGTPVS
jgi:hypothetical protein